MSSHAEIQRLIHENEVVLFMKGTRRAPQCGFSAAVVELLDRHLEDYVTVNVLADGAMRQAVKEYSNWPTIPQLYVKQAFIGGCDIVREMAADGELERLLAANGTAATTEDATPRVRLTTEAEEAFVGFADGASAVRVRLEVSAKFDYEVFFDEQRAGDVIVEAGRVTLLVDRQSARRADGLVVDYVEGPQGSGFRMDNPNEPPPVRFVSVPELKAWIDGGKPLEIFDVRSPAERVASSIPGAHALDERGFARLEALERTTPLVLYCRRGISSQSAARHCIEMGFREVYSLDGGMNAWGAAFDATY